jgi:prepilin-type processing-associated H-X9-DG protein
MAQGGTGTGKEVIYGYEYNARGYTRNSLSQPNLGLGGDRLPGADPLPLPGQVRFIRESETVCPSDMIAIGDCALGAKIFAGGGGLPGAGNALVITGLGFFTNPSDWEMKSAEWMRKRHDGQWNMVFCDGHVVGLKIKPLMDYHSDVVLQHWNRDHLPHRDFVRDLP